MMSWMDLITIIGSLGTFTYYMISRLDADLRASNQRIDQLYQMFVDLLRERR